MLQDGGNLLVRASLWHDAFRKKKKEKKWGFTGVPTPKSDRVEIKRNTFEQLAEVKLALSDQVRHNFLVQTDHLQDERFEQDDLGGVRNCNTFCPLNCEDSIRTGMPNFFFFNLRFYILHFTSYLGNLDTSEFQYEQKPQAVSH